MVGSRTADGVVRVRDVESFLFETFGHDEDAWDNVGLVAGDPAAVVKRAYVALDQSMATVDAALAEGCDLLVSHHPAFIDPVKKVVASGPEAKAGAMVVYKAVSNGLSLIAMHTNLDKSMQALELAADLFGCRLMGRLEADGYGCVMDGRGMTAEELARRVAIAFECEPELWDAGTRIERIAWCSGSCGSLAQAAVDAGCDILVGGEMGYHAHLDLLAKGVSSMVIGHDKSELPYVRLLESALAGRFDKVEYVTCGRDVAWRRVRG
jgi:putative NIF3 family GTP cyclohydrolase 1 type 2